MSKLLITLMFYVVSELVLAAQIDPAALHAKTKKIPVIALLSPGCLTNTSSITSLRIGNRACARTLSQAINVKNFRPIWISHAVAFDISKEQIAELAKQAWVEKIYFNHVFAFENSVSDYNSVFKLPYSFAQIRREELRIRHPDLDGRNQVVGIIDTGVDASHDELKGKVLKFFDADKNLLTAANDLAGHGTHVAGILGAKSFGVAPAAQLIAAKMLSIESALRAMQFIAEQKDIRVVNNSWGEQQLPDIEIYYRALNVWESLSILPVFSAGNAGPNPETLTHPKEHPSTIVVGATNKDGTIANSSSRGPGKFNGVLVYKPELIAPGEKIVSTLPGNKFGEWSGASMAAPLVTGAAALMLQVNPHLNPQRIREILISSAQDFSGGWTPDRGYGMLDVTMAVNMAAKEVKRSLISPLMLNGFFPEPEKEVKPTAKDIFYFPTELQGSTWK